MQKTKLDIIIPTKDKGHILARNLEHLSNISNLIRIVVLDSSKFIDPQLNEVLLSSNKLSEIRYINTPYEFAVLENFREGEKYIISDFFCFLGDDDTVTSEIVDIINYLESNNLDACISSFPCNLLWGGYKSRFLNIKDPLALVCRKFKKTKIILNSNKQRSKAIEALSRGPIDLPRAYLGVCSSNVLKKINKDGKELFDSVSVDIYSSMTISLYVDKYLKVDSPFIIPGASPGSASAEQAKNSEHHHLKKRKNMYWSKMVPKINKEHCIWSNALIHSIEVHNIKIDDYSGLYSRLILSYPKEYKKINQSLFHHRSKYSLILKSFLKLTNDIIFKIISRFKGRPKIFKLSQIKDVDSYLNSKEIS